MGKIKDILKELQEFSDNLFQPGFTGKWFRFSLVIIIALIVGLRLAYISKPSLEKTSWKEIDHIAISENFKDNNYNIFKPTITWPAEPPRVTSMEFPIVPYIASLFYTVLGFNVFSVRLLTLLSAILLMVFVEKLTRIFFGSYVSLAAAFFAGLLGMYNEYYNQLFSEPVLITFTVISIYYFYKWAELGMKKYTWQSILSFSLILLLKPTALYTLLPISFVFFAKFRFNFRAMLKFSWVVALSLLPAVAWYAYAYYLGKTSIDVFGVFGGHDKFQTIHELTSHRYYHIMRVSLLNIIGERPGLLLILIGILYILVTKKGFVFLAYLLAIISFFIILAEGNADTSYRQLTIVPVAAVLLSVGIFILAFVILKFADLILAPTSKLYLNKNYSLALVILVIAGFFTINFHKIPKPELNIFHSYEWNVAQEIDKYVTKGDKIVTYGSYSIHKGGNDLSPVIYYYSGTVGWSMQEGDLSIEKAQSFKDKGAKLMVFLFLNREKEVKAFAETLKQYYPVLYQDDDNTLILKY